MVDGSSCIILQWFGRANDELAGHSGDPFESFIYAWISFNGWAACCVDPPTDQDRALVGAMASDPFLHSEFEALLQGDPEFHQWANKFYH